MKYFIACLLMINAAWALPINCPELKDISRTNGEYAWQSQNSLWEGYFALPFYGRGDSSQVTNFLEARWIQLNNLKNPQGIVECDYAGNVPGEVIRFILLNAQGGPKPTDSAWACAFSPPFPSAQCSCAGEPTQCIFEKS
jgi:hypothetical protein